MKRMFEDPRVRFGRMLGLLFCAAGFGAIVLGWHGMARVACPDCQLPYLISGGFGGLALVLFGVGLLVTAQLRAERIKLAQEVGDSLRPVAAGTATNGGGDGKVVAGGSTYHRPGCRLVREKAELEEMSGVAARAAGLSPCRVCVPEAADGSGLTEGGSAPAEAEESGRKGG